MSFSDYLLEAMNNKQYDKYLGTPTTRSYNGTNSTKYIISIYPDEVTVMIGPNEKTQIPTLLCCTLANGYIKCGLNFNGNLDESRIIDISFTKKEMRKLLDKAQELTEIYF